MRTLITALFSFAMLTGSSALADTYYVRKGGNDNNSGKSPGAAFATLGEAADEVEAGDIVYVGAGTYSESTIEPDESGTLSNRILFIADTNGSRTGDAGEVILTNTRAPVIKVSGESYITIDGFTFSKGKGAISIDGCSWIEILDCTIDQPEKYGIEIKNSSSILVQDTSVSNSTEDGIKVEKGSSIQIVECTITNSRKKGIKIKKAESSATIDRCTLRKNNDHGIGVEDGATVVITNTLSTLNRKDGIHTHKNSTLTIWNCTTVQNGENGIKAHDGGTLEIVNTITAANGKDGIRFDLKKSKKGGPISASHHHNISYGNGGSNWSGLSPTSTDLSIDPLFVGISDFQLTGSSPARDTGADAISYTDHDMLGVDRPSGTGWDIGCYEGDAGPPPIQYVRTNGSDSNDGLSPNRALRTIQKAISNCTGSGCTIYVGPGTYEESLEIGVGAGTDAQSGTEIAPNTIIADVGGVHTTDDPGPVLIDGKDSDLNGLSMNERDFWVISGFKFVNQKEYGAHAILSGMNILNCEFDATSDYGIFITATGDVTISDNIFHRDADSMHLIWVYPVNTNQATSVSVIRNEATLQGSLYLSSNLSAGFRWNRNRKYSYGIIVYARYGLLDEIEISNNQLTDFYLPIYSYSRTTGATATISNNTITGSLYSVYHYGYGSRQQSTLTNNLIDTCYYGMLSYTRRGSDTRVAGHLENNITMNMARYRRAYELDIITGSPMFTDAKHGDFSLLSRSPAIDAGTLVGAPTTDIAGRSRPTDGDHDGTAAIDIGSNELVGERSRIRVVQWKEIGGDHNE